MSLLLGALVIDLADAGGRGIGIQPVTFLSSDTTMNVDLSYVIPFPSLTFVREDSAYAARFDLRFQCWNEQRIPVRAMDWVDSVRVGDYDATTQAESVLHETRSVSVPRQALSAEAAVQDLQSERIQPLEFEVRPPGVTSELKLTRTSNAERRTSKVDTLYVEVEVYQQPKRSKKSEGRRVKEEPSPFNLHPSPFLPVESLYVRIMNGPRALAGQRVGIARDSWRTHVKLAFPLKGYESATYTVVAEARNRRGAVVEQGQAEFDVQGSFFGSEKDYKEKVGELLWIATTAQMSRLRSCGPDQRESLWQAFWDSTSRRPSSVVRRPSFDEQMYFERIQYSIDNFGHGDLGYRSDRAMVYVKLGPPDNIESSPFELTGNAYEIWDYNGLGRSFTFTDVNGLGAYRLSAADRRYFGD
jgi:GWxTD domain-containing protein